MDLVIKNCRLVDKAGEYFIKIDDGKITDISKTPLEASESIDIKKQLHPPKALLTPTYISGTLD